MGGQAGGQVDGWVGRRVLLVSGNAVATVFVLRVRVCVLN